jgi:hypothetical protein
LHLEIGRSERRRADRGGVEVEARRKRQGSSQIGLRQKSCFLTKQGRKPFLLDNKDTLNR